jgi:hypothetical protein
MNINDLNLETGAVPGTTFQFSATRPDDLGASEYTLVSVAVDVSGSVSSFKDELVKMLNAILAACKKSSRAENLLMRTLRFDDSVSEIHGFAPLSSLDVYEESDLNGGGMTALIDASLSGIGAMNAYGKKLVDLNYSVNGILFVLTDGEENRSTIKDPARIKVEIDRAVRGETLKGVTTILIGINALQYRSSLKQLQQDAGFSFFIEVADATPQRLAKLAGFVSKSISSTSQSLAQGATTPIVVDNLTI